MAARSLTKTQEQARWHVLGAGSVGSLFASYLHLAGAHVILLPRHTNDSGSRTITNGPASGSYAFECSNPSEEAPIDALLVTTKAYDVCDAVQSVQHRLHADTIILLLVNGMGLAEALAALSIAGRLYLATTTEGVHRSDTSHLVHAGTGATRIGRQGERPPAWFSLYQAEVPNCHWEPDIDAALWLKLAINCAINPLTAIHDCRNGELGQRPVLQAQVTELCAEIAKVCALEGHPETARTLESQVFEVIRGTAKNRSSMLQDVSAGRPTEIDYLTGFLVQRAALLGVDVPANTRMLEQVKAIA